jgi:SAM-dependent methyltransferase
MSSPETRLVTECLLGESLEETRRYPAAFAYTSTRDHETNTTQRSCLGAFVVVDRLFSDPALADLYDVFCRGRPDFSFYLPLVMSAESVLDVGCGTGELLRLARQTGHTGRLCGLDPADPMLDQARTRSDIEWILGDLASVHWNQEFDLVVMTGHAFQVFIEDDELRASLAAIQSALTHDGRFAFETRNPQVREWEHWTIETPIEVPVSNRAAVQYTREVEAPVRGDLVRFTQKFSSPGWDGPKESSSTLRFLGADALSSLLSETGLAIEQQFGDWDRQPLTDSSPEIITIARRGSTSDT